MNEIMFGKNSLVLDIDKKTIIIPKDKITFIEIKNNNNKIYDITIHILDDNVKIFSTDDYQIIDDLILWFNLKEEI